MPAQLVYRLTQVYRFFSSATSLQTNASDEELKVCVSDGAASSDAVRFYSGFYC